MQSPFVDWKTRVPGQNGSVTYVTDTSRSALREGWHGYPDEWRVLNSDVLMVPRTAPRARSTSTT